MSWTVQKGAEDPTLMDLKPVVVWYYSQFLEVILQCYISLEEKFK